MTDIDRAPTTVADFLATVPAPMHGNSAWASRYAGDIRRIITQTAYDSPRSRQQHLGPSELGSRCDRQIVSKLAGLARTNHVTDPWPSIVGTAVHAWLAGAFAAYNLTYNVVRFVPEQRVYPHADHSGTADLYDAFEEAVVDHKVLGATTMAKLRGANGPPRRYRIQLLLYGQGYAALGLPVRRIVLAAYPRTSSSLDGLWVWEHTPNADDAAQVESTLERVAVLKTIANEVANGMPINKVPRYPDD